LFGNNVEFRGDWHEGPDSRGAGDAGVKTIRNWPPPLNLPKPGHFTQEAGVIIVEEAMASFSSG
jgi:hypothetical protein